MEPTARIVAPVAVRVVRNGEAAASAEDGVDDEARYDSQWSQQKVGSYQRLIVGAA